MIGVFDSGIGGLTVVEEIRKLFPEEKIEFIPDTEHFPYGTKTTEEVIGFSRAIARRLADQGACAIVIACNTATAAALDTLQREMPVPVIGVIGPGAAGAVQATRNGKIGILATDGTVRSGAYPAAIRQLLPEAEVYQQGCPEFVLMAERHQWEGPEPEAAAREYMKEMLAAGVDTIVLGCTHFPYLEKTIKKVAGEDVTLVNPALATAVLLKSVFSPS